MHYEDLTVAQRTLFHDFKQRIRDHLADYSTFNADKREFRHAFDRFFDCFQNNIPFQKMLPHLHELLLTYPYRLIERSYDLFYTYKALANINMQMGLDTAKEHFKEEIDLIKFEKLKRHLRDHFQANESSQGHPPRDAKVDLYLKEFCICFEAGECFLELFPDHFNYLCEHFSHLRWLGDVNCAIIYNSLLYLSRHPRQRREATPSKEYKTGLQAVGVSAEVSSNDTPNSGGLILNDSWTFTLKLKEKEEEEEEEHSDPEYYQGQDFDVIDIIEQFELDFHLGNVVKYLLRAGKKHGESLTKDLDKARWYLDRYIDYVGEGV